MNSPSLIRGPWRRAVRAVAQRRVEGAADGGLTLVEMVVALFLVGLVLTSFLGVSIAGASASRAAEVRSRANQVGNQEVETFKSIPWTSLGLYDNDTTSGGASPAATCGSESVVSLGANAPSPRVAPVFQRVATMNNRTFTITNCITWRDDSADGTVAGGNELNSDQGHDVKHLVTTVSWTLLGKTRSLTFDSLRAPTAAEVPPVSHDTATLALTAGAPSPASQQLAADSTLTSPLTLSATTSLTATGVTVTYAGQSGSVTQSLASSDGGTTWTLTIPTGSAGGKFNAGTLTLSYQATSGSGSAQATNTVTLTAPPTPFTVTATASPTSVFLDSNGYLTSALTLNVTTSQVASAVSVSYPLASGTGSRTLVNVTGGTSWQVVLAAGAGSGQFTATSSELFTVTATNTSGSVTGTTTVTLAPPAAAAISFVSATLPYIGSGEPIGSLCVKNGNGSSANKTHVAETVTFTVDNMVTTDTVTMSWTNSAGTASIATRSTSGGHTVFTFTVPAGTLFTGSTSDFTFVGTRASDGAGINKVVTFPVRSSSNAPSSTSSSC